MQIILMILLLVGLFWVGAALLGAAQVLGWRGTDLTGIMAFGHGGLSTALARTTLAHRPLRDLIIQLVCFPVRIPFGRINTGYDDCRAVRFAAFDGPSLGARFS
jgi:hypothetical protein